MRMRRKRQEKERELDILQRDGMSVSADVAVGCVVFKSTQSISHVEHTCTSFVLIILAALEIQGVQEQGSAH